MEDPAQTGPLLAAAGCAGVGVTTTLVVPGAEEQIPSVAVTEYTPAFAGCAAVIEGFWAVLLKAGVPGPVQE